MTALATPTVNLSTGGRPSAPLYHLDISVAGAVYATGGFTGAAAKFQAAAKTAGYNISISKENIFGIIPIDTKGYQLGYDKSGDALLVYHGNNDASDGPGVEPDTVDLSSVTFRFCLLVE